MIEVYASLVFTYWAFVWGFSSFFVVCEVVSFNGWSWIPFLSLSVRLREVRGVLGHVRPIC